MRHSKIHLVDGTKMYANIQFTHNKKKISLFIVSLYLVATSMYQLLIH